MLADYLDGKKAGPLTPDGWVFAADALVAAMGSFDDQRAGSGIRLPFKQQSVDATYHNLGALDPRDTIARSIHRQRLSEVRLDDVRMAAFGAANLIATACEAKRIQSATRAVKGGPLVPLAAYKWGIDDPWRRFWQCQMDPRYPFALNLGHWIFFERDSLFAEIDAWRLRYGLGRNWTVDDALKAANQPEMSALKNSPIPALRPISEAELERWFKARVVEFADRKPPRWWECWEAAKASFPEKKITRDVLQRVRRSAAPEWRSGPR